MKPKNNKFYPALIALLLASLACVCTSPTSLLPSTLIPPATPVGVAVTVPVATVNPGQANTPTPSIEVDFPIYDGSDGRQTVRMEYMELDSTVLGGLASNTVAHNWLIELTSGQTIDARVYGDDVDTILTLIDENGQVIMSVDDSVGLDPQIVTVITNSGTYTLRITSFGPGNYTFEVKEIDDPAAAGFDIDPNLPLVTGSDSKATPIVKAIDIPSTTQGQLPNSSTAHNYVIDVLANTTISIQITSPTNTDTRYRILDLNGVELAYQDDDDGYDPQGTHTLQQAGQYTIRVDSFSSGSYIMDVRSGP